MNYAILFPGQGSQHVGMGAELFDARPDLLGDPADEVLGWSLRDACLEGPEERLTSTDVAQPALYALSYALWSEATQAGLPTPQMAAGHSLGEYTALAASGMVEYLAGLELVAARGRAMAAAAGETSSSMAALLGATPESVEEVAAARRADGGSLYVANLNAPGQVVVAGGQDDINWLVDSAAGLGIRRAVELAVAGAFHSPYMAPAADALAGALDATNFAEGAFPVVSNVTAAVHHADHVAGLLAEQLTAPVRFAESLASMAEMVDGFLHCGPGDVTAGMAKRSARGKAALVINSLDDIGDVRDQLIQ